MNQVENLLLEKRNITIHNPSREEACECHQKNRCFPENEKEISCKNWRERDRERESYLIWSEKRRKETAQGDLRAEV